MRIYLYICVYIYAYICVYMWKKHRLNTMLCLIIQVHTNGDMEILRTTVEHHVADIKCTATGTDGKTDVKTPFLYLFPA